MFSGEGSGLRVEGGVFLSRQECCLSPWTTWPGSAVSRKQNSVSRKQASVSMKQESVSRKQVSVSRKQTRVSRKQASVPDAAGRDDSLGVGHVEGRHVPIIMDHMAW